MLQRLIVASLCDVNRTLERYPLLERTTVLSNLFSQTNFDHMNYNCTKLCWGQLVFMDVVVIVPWCSKSLGGTPRHLFVHLWTTSILLLIDIFQLSNYSSLITACWGLNSKSEKANLLSPQQCVLDYPGFCLKLPHGFQPNVQNPWILDICKYSMST